MRHARRLLRPVWRRTAAWVVSCAGLFLVPTMLGGTDLSDSAKALERLGLRRVDRVWMLPLEHDLRRDLSELPKRRERIVRIQRELGERVAKSTSTWARLAPSVAELESMLARLSTDDPRRDVIQRQLDAANRKASHPAELSRQGDVRRAVIQWAGERNSLTTAIARIRQAAPRVEQLYAELRERAEVAPLFAALAPGERIGPWRDYKPDVERLSDYEHLCYTSWTPAYWQGKLIRFTAVFDERFPMTFCWDDGLSETTTLTHNAAESAGLKIDELAPREAVSLGGERRVTGRRAIVPRLRIGKLVLRDVPVIVLPPEAEDWGCRLGRAAISGHSFRAEPEKLRLAVDAD